MTRYLPIVLAVLAGTALGLRTRLPHNDPPATPPTENPAPAQPALPSPAGHAAANPVPPRETPAAAPEPEPVLVGPDGVIYRRVRPRR